MKGKNLFSNNLTLTKQTDIIGEGKKCAFPYYG
jgi:hypothetical protein